MDFTGEEMFNIRLCHECYSNANQHPHNWLTMICSEPHLVVWVKLKPNPYWPAKLMAFDRNTNKIDVRFFGHQHRRAVVTPKDCIMYTEIDPNIDGNHQNEDFQFSRKVILFYNDLLYLELIHDFRWSLNIASKSLHWKSHGEIRLISLCQTEYAIRSGQVWAPFVWYATECMATVGQNRNSATNTEASAGTS